jgi:hypothetical protein
MAEWHCGGCGGANPDGMRFCGHCGAARAAEAPPTADPNPLGTMVSRQVAERVRVTGGSLPTERRLVTVLFADASRLHTADTVYRQFGVAWAPVPRPDADELTGRA